MLLHALGPQFSANTGPLAAYLLDSTLCPCPLQWPSPIFLLGVALVLLSVFMYGRALDARKLALYWQKAQRVSGQGAGWGLRDRCCRVTC